MIKAEIIADSINERDCRLTTFILEYPRFVLAEVNTHRMLSRSVASSRAIPVNKMIELVKSNPAMPEFWGKNQAGMQSTEELIGAELEAAKTAWLSARDSAVQSALALQASGMHKQYVNRMIENFMYVRAIISGTDFHNFFALRAHRDAQPEFRVLAERMLEAYNASTPSRLKTGEWHIPFGDKIDEYRLADILKKQYIDFNISNEEDQEALQIAKQKVAVARCARVSYYNFEGKDDYEKDLETCEKLFGSVPRHLSPAEHVAQAMDEDAYIGNFRGFKQYRKFFRDENLEDKRIKQHGN